MKPFVNNNGNGNGNTNGQPNTQDLYTTNGHGVPESELMSTPLLPEGFKIPISRNVHPSTRMRQLLQTEPYLFGPGVYEPMTAQLVTDACVFVSQPLVATLSQSA